MQRRRQWRERKKWSPIKPTTADNAVGGETRREREGERERRKSSRAGNRAFQPRMI